MHPAAEVLLIEDEESDRQLVQELVALKGRGRVHITEAGDLHSGLALLDARPFDLVMLDTRLRDASALAALRAVGEQAHNTPNQSHPTIMTVQKTHATRHPRAWDVVVRGGLNSMWSAMNNLLAVSAPELRAKQGLQPT